MANFQIFKCARLDDLVAFRGVTDIHFQISNLLDICFRTQNYTQNFPTVFVGPHDRWSFVLLSNEHVIGYCNAGVINWQHESGTMLRVACIGSVATHPAFQKQGCASALLDFAEDAVWQAGFHGACLFSDLDLFYSKRGYRSLGAEQLVSLNFDALHQSSLTIESLDDLAQFEWIDHSTAIHDTKLLAKMWSLMSQSTQDSILSFVDFVTLMQTPNVAVCLLQLNSELKAFGMIGKGIDFQCVLHGVCGITKAHKRQLILHVVQRLGSVNWLTNARDNDIIENKVTSGVFVKPNPSILNLHLCAALDSGAAYVRGIQSS